MWSVYIFHFVKEFYMSNVVLVYIYIYGELGRFPLQITSKTRILKYWIKIITGMSNPLVKRAYDIEYEMCEKSPSFSSWTMSLKSLLYIMGLNFAWDNQNIVNQHAFLHLCKQRLHAGFIFDQMECCFICQFRWSDI